MPSHDDFSAIGASIPSFSQKDRRQGEREENVLEDGIRAVQKEIHAIVVWALRGGALALGLLVLVRLWHMGAPLCWRWLEPYNLQEIDKMLFSSAFGGVVLSYLKEIMRPLK